MIPRRTSGRNPRHFNPRLQNGRQAGAGIVALLALSTLGFRPGQTSRPGKTSAPPHLYAWVPIYNYLLQKLTGEGKTIAYPGGTAGVTVDRKTGDLFLVVAGQGLWKSTDKGKSFDRIDGGAIGGRCETGYSLNADPAGHRLACFMLDGPSGMTLDDGKTWTTFAQMGRGWDFGAVDWSRSAPQDMLAVHHESGRELYRSMDGGKSWKLLGKGFTAIGMFDGRTFVGSRGDGILRSLDGGTTWTKVSNITPSGRVLCKFNGVGYWIAPEGLLISLDMGRTWHYTGTPVEAAWGPYFGTDETQIVVVGKKGNVVGAWQTNDSTKTWKMIVPYPNIGGNFKPNLTPSTEGGMGWFDNFGWDWKSNLFFTSRMGNPAFAIKTK